MLLDKSFCKYIMQLMDSINITTIYKYADKNFYSEKLHTNLLISNNHADTITTYYVVNS